MLADALVEDILATPAEVLLAESREDHGDPRALAAEFERIVTANAWPVGVPEVGVTAPGPGRRARRRPTHRNGPLPGPRVARRARTALAKPPGAARRSPDPMGTAHRRRLLARPGCAIRRGGSALGKSRRTR